MRKRNLILVEWEDIATYGRWRREESTIDVKPMICYSVGWKMKAPSSKKLAISSTRNCVDECCDMIVMNKSDIKSIRRLE